MEDWILDALLLRLSVEDRYFTVKELLRDQDVPYDIKKYLRKLVDVGYAAEYGYGDGKWKLTTIGKFFLSTGGYMGINKKNQMEEMKKDNLYNLEIKHKRLSIINSKLTIPLAIFAASLSIWNLLNSIYHFIK